MTPSLINKTGLSCNAGGDWNVFNKVEMTAPMISSVFLWVLTDIKPLIWSLQSHQQENKKLSKFPKWTCPQLWAKGHSGLWRIFMVIGICLSKMWQQLQKHHGCSLSVVIYVWVQQQMMDFLHNIFRGSENIKSSLLKKSLTANCIQ